MKKFSFLLIVLFVVTGTFAQGLKMVGRVTVYDGGQSYSNPMELKITDTYLRINEYSIEGVEQESMIFNGNTSELLILSHATKEFMTISKAEMTELMTQLAMVKEELKAQMEMMSPEEKEYMEQIMAQQGISLEDIPKTSYEATGRKDQVLGRSCAHYEGRADDKLITEIWVSSYKGLGILEKDINGLLLFSQYMKDIAEGFQAMSDDDFNFLLHEDYQGIPLKERSYEGGQITSEMVVVEVSNEKFSDTEFQAPASYSPMSVGGEGY
jgi:hypothetical protein